MVVLVDIERVEPGQLRRINFRFQDHNRLYQHTSQALDIISEDSAGPSYTSSTRLRLSRVYDVPIVHSSGAIPLCTLTI